MNAATPKSSMGARPIRGGRERVKPVVPPPVAAPFPPEFRRLLRELLARAPRAHGERVERLPRRRAALGQSGTFAGHRPYVRGDDPRRIDWAAYARSGELFVMQLEEEERRVATILLDLSPRLVVGTPSRRVAALRLAAVIGGLALRHLDGLTVVAPGGGTNAVSAFAGVADVERLLVQLEQLPWAEVAPPTAVQTLLQSGPLGRLHWISDFVAPRAVERNLAALRRRGGRVVGWLPALPDDVEPPARGYLTLQDPATGKRVVVTVDDALRSAMRRELAVLRRAQERVFAQSGSTFVRWPVPAADDHRRPDYEEVLRQCRT
ncbi:MAG: DUF58 domain-containing protein [bacterium]|nr:DUF58 domain-containing protein [bacterium]